MKIIFDKSISELGIKNIVIGIARNVDPNAELSASFLEKQNKMQEWALQCDINEIIYNSTIQGYIDLLQKVGRSVKKNPPTALALIRNIQHRGSIPHINSIIDIYNVETLNSLLAIGGHDFNKINEYIEFTVAQKEDVFLPISSTEKHVAETDYVYRDKNGIINTSVETRLEALKRIQNDLAECMANLEFETYIVNAGEDRGV